MSFCLLGAHVNSTMSELPETIAEWKPSLMVVLDHSDVWHSVKAASPNTLFVGRVYQEFEPNFNRPDLDPVATAADHFARVMHWAQRMGATYDYWQGVNEPVIQSPAAMQRYADFEAERARLMDSEGFRVVVGSFAVGNPDLPLWQDFLPALEAARQYGGALALHEYAWPTLDREAPWYLLRHRKVYGGEPEHNWAGLPSQLQTLPLLITECGLDGMIERADGPRGWKAHYGENREQYLEQLAWYDAELQKDPYVSGAAIYCCGALDWHWSSYDIWPEVARDLAGQARPLYRMAEAKPVTPSAADEGAPWGQVFDQLDRIIQLLKQ